MSTLVVAMVRAVRDPALAWDLAAEAMAAATLAWETFPGGSRMAWITEHGRRVLGEASRTGRVPSTERVRNGRPRARTLALDEQRMLRELALEPLELDERASVEVERLAREAPAPGVLSELALSSLTLRAPGSRERADA